MNKYELKQQIRDVFDPLTKRLGLYGPVEVSLATTEFHLSYSNQSVGLEVTVEMIDFFIYVLIFMPTGDLPPKSYIDENGKTQKLYLQEALKKVGIDVSKETHALQQLGRDFSNCSEMVAILARLVEQNWPLILKHRSYLFS